MSGHSKWSKVKHQKEVIDAVKGKLFTKVAAGIIIAIREGGGIADPNSNFKLRLAIEKAREVNMPKENIERAIARGKGRGEGANLNTVVFEAFGPKGTAFIITGATDNNQRTTANVKNALERGGGRLVSQGAVAYLFDYSGQIVVEKSNKSFDEMLIIVLDAGGDDVVEEQGNYVVYTLPQSLHKVLISLSNLEVKVLSSELIYRPKALVKLQSKEEEDIVLKLTESLESLEDIQVVYTNIEFLYQ